MKTSSRRQARGIKTIFDRYRSRPYIPKEIINEFGNMSIEISQTEIKWKGIMKTSRTELSRTV